jgi:serine/threonine-protein kinase
MSPEAITSPDRVAAHADLYSLGATAYYLLTGSPPFQGTSVLEVCSKHLYTEPEPPSHRLGRDLPGALEELVLTCLAKDPEKRPESAEALAERLRTAGVPTWSPAQARAFWSNLRRDTSVPISRAAVTRTIHVDLGARRSRSSDGRVA